MGGIGFITWEGMEPSAGEADDKTDILVHYMQIKQSSEDGFKSLEQGSKVEYELEPDPKHPEKQIAVNVTGVNGEDCCPKRKGAGRKGKGKGKKGKSKGKGKGKKDDDDGEEDEE